MKALDFACRSPWAITEDALQTILEIAARENLTPAAVEAQLGRPLDNSHSVSIRDGVATIPVNGPIMRYADLFSQISGATSIDTLATDLKTALDSPSVHSILLQIDSPGGTVNGTSEFAQMVYEARQQKPIIAYVDGVGASAAYWIASAADEVVVNDTAIVGSIGVIAPMKGKDARSAKDVTFVSSQSPDKNPDPETERGRAQIQTMVDNLASVFVETVARNRGTTPEAVLSDFGQGGVFVGAHAVEAGLADRVSSYESVLKDMKAAWTSPAVHANREERPTMAKLSTQPVSAALAEPRADTQEIHVEKNETPAAEDATAIQVEASNTQLDELKAMVANLEKQNASILAQAEAAQAAADALAKEKTLGELAASAQNWVGDATAHAEFMYALSDEQKAHYVQTMNAAAAQIEKGDLFATKGTTNPTDGHLSAKDELNSRVHAVMAEQKIDYADAMAQVTKTDTDLFARYRAEFPGVSN